MVGRRAGTSVQLGVVPPDLPARARPEMLTVTGRYIADRQLAGPMLVMVSGWVEPASDSNPPVIIPVKEVQKEPRCPDAGFTTHAICVRRTCPNVA